ncbi:MAG: hypothetical protein ACKO1O_01980 [Erythrobacter sp.]
MTRSLIAPALAFTALASATAAQAQAQACIPQADMTDAIVYAMPIAYEAAQTACANRFAEGGFMAREGDAWIAAYRSGQDKAWPGALRVIKTFIADDAAASGTGGDDMSAMITALPENALRPFVDAMVGQMIAKEIKPDSCGTIERAVELLSPLPGENIGGLVAFMLELDDKSNSPLCGAPTARAKAK